MGSFNDQCMAVAFAALRLTVTVSETDRVGRLATAAQPPPGRGLTFLQNGLCYVEKVIVASSACSSPLARSKRR